jgi:outer membrane protein OmpA-like peptidoglycan-associated protein
MSFRTTLRLALAAGIAACLASAALADATIPEADVEGAADDALVKRYEGSFIVYYEKQDYTDFAAPLSELKRHPDPDKRDQNNNVVYQPEKEVELEGTLTRLFYVLPADRSPLEVLRNYQDVIEEGGGEVVYECKKEECGGNVQYGADTGGGDMTFTQYFFYDSDLEMDSFSNAACAVTSDMTDLRYLTARIPRDSGDAYVTVQTFQMLDDLYCKAINGRTIAIVHVLEPKERDKKMVVVEAKEMEESLTNTGSVSLYGIFFDFDKADIKPESEPTLKEIAKLLTEEAGLAVVVVGHTDNKGKFDYNLQLSAKRADAVKQALVSQYGIDGGRLTAAGAGMMAPVASNDSEEGRAKNRRVGLVKAN